MTGQESTLRGRHGCLPLRIDTRGRWHFLPKPVSRHVDRSEARLAEVDADESTFRVAHPHQCRLAQASRCRRRHRRLQSPSKSVGGKRMGGRFTGGLLPRCCAYRQQVVRSWAPAPPIATGGGCRWRRFARMLAAMSRCRRPGRPSHLAGAAGSRNHARAAAFPETPEGTVLKS